MSRCHFGDQLDIPVLIRPYQLLCVGASHCFHIFQVAFVSNEQLELFEDVPSLSSSLAVPLIASYLGGVSVFFAKATIEA